jgi:SAM-dependent methyltransferase
LRGVPHRVRRVLSRCVALLRVPELLDQFASRIDAQEAAIQEHLHRIVHEQAQIQTYLRPITDQQAYIHKCLVQISNNQSLNQASADSVNQLGATLSAGLAANQASADSINQLGATLSTELAAIPTRVGEAMSRLQLELSTQLAFSLHDIAQPVVQQNLFGIAEHQASMAQQINLLVNEQFEAKNHIIHVGTNTASLLQNLTTIVGEIRNAAIHLDTSTQSRLNTIEYERLAGLYEQLHHVTAGLLRLRADVEVNRPQHPQEALGRYAPAQPRALDADLQRAQAEFPHVYPMWAERLEEMRQACLETKVGNVAHAGDPRSETFRSFVDIHAAGRALDVGCGVFGRPFYLSSYPASLISGLDPLEPTEPPDFEFVRGIQEYLPWPDGSFSTVISATSLDHCLSLDRTLAEIRRVLCPAGKFLLWIDSIPGSPRFAPDAPDFAPADRFHLFHFDTAWFEPMLNEWFHTVDRIELRGLEFSRILYCLKLRSSEVAKQRADPRP